MKILLTLILVGFSWVAESPAQTPAKESQTLQVVLGKSVWQLKYKRINPDGSLEQVSGRMEADDTKSFQAQRVVVSPGEIELREGYVLRRGNASISNSNPGEGAVHITADSLKVEGPSKTHILPR